VTERDAARTVQVAPWVVIGVSAVLAGAAVALSISGREGTDLVVVSSTIAVLGLVFGITGAIVASRLPGNIIGWIFCVLAFLFESSGLADAYVAYGSESGALLPARAWVAWTSQWFLNVSSPTLIILCFLLFPTGRLPSRRWRSLVLIVVVIAVLSAVSAALVPGTLPDYPIKNPAGIEPAAALRTLADASLLLLVGPLMLASAVSLFVRLRRSSGTERQQIKWFAYAAMLLAAELVIVNGLSVLFEDVIDREINDLVPFLIFLAVLSGIPVAMGIAVLRYRLYEIDIIINRTLVYGSLTGTLALVYFGGVTATQALLRTVTGQEQLPQLVVVASTLVIAALFNPLRRRIQRFIDRSFYRRKYDARRTLEGFSTKLRDEMDLEALKGDLVGLVGETMQPAHVSLWLRPETTPKGGQEM
jgi:hypothetical protein